MWDSSYAYSSLYEGATLFNDWAALSPFAFATLAPGASILHLIFFLFTLVINLPQPRLFLKQLVRFKTAAAQQKYILYLPTYWFKTNYLDGRHTLWLMPSTLLHVFGRICEMLWLCVCVMCAYSPLDPICFPGYLQRELTDNIIKVV